MACFLALGLLFTKSGDFLKYIIFTVKKASLASDGGEQYIIEACAKMNQAAKLSPNHFISRYAAGTAHLFYVNRIESSKEKANQILSRGLFLWPVN